MKIKLNKRILSALLAFVTFLSCCPVVSLASDGFVITSGGATVTNVSFDKHEKLEISAENIPEGTYQWQIMIPGTDIWVDIQGQTGQTMGLSYAVVGSLMDGNSAYVRCAAISGGEEVAHTAVLRATVTEKVEEPAVKTPVEIPAAPATTVPTEAATEAPTEEPTEVATEAPTEAATEAPTEAATEAPTEAATEAPTEAATEASTEAATEAPTEAATEAPAEPATEAPTEVTTEAPTEAATEAPTEAPTEIQRVMMFAIARNTDATEDPGENQAETEEMNMVSITIQYTYLDKDDNSVEGFDWPPYVANIQTGDPYEKTIQIKEIPGYTASLKETYEGVTLNTADNTITLNLKKVDTSVTYVVTYKLTKVQYYVRRYLQNVNNDLYTEASAINGEVFWGFPGDTPNTSEIYKDDQYAGFTALFYQPDTIAADGSTVFEIYYDRNYYLINFDLDGGYGVSPVYARYETQYSVPTPTKPGYSFGGWQLVKDGNPEGEIIQNLSGTVPAYNQVYRAIWMAATGTKYSVAYWVVDSQGNKTYIGSGVRRSASETKIDGSDDLNSAAICGQEGHIHENGCFSCGHAHTASCYGSLGKEQNPPSDLEIKVIQALGQGEPEPGYIYRLDYGGATYYKIYNGTSWHCWKADTYGQITELVSSGVIDEASYTDTNGTVYNVYKYHVKLNCDYTHDDGCTKTCSIPYHIHGDSCYFDTAHLEYIDSATDKQVTVKGDGSTVVNVYYQYEEYTMKFYYAFSKTTGSTTTYHVVGGSSFHFGWTDTEDSLEALKKYTEGENTNQCGQVDELPKLNATGIARYGQSIPQNATYEEVTYEEDGKTYNYNVTYDSYVSSGTTYKLYYVSFTARYNDNISNLWPSGVFKSVTRTGNNTHNWSSKEAFVSAWNGEHHVLYTQNHSGAQTIKGTYQTLDENLLWQYADWYNDGTPVTCDKNGEVDFLCFWDNGANVNWSIPSLFRYYTYVEALPGEEYTTTYNGKNYYQFGNYLDTIDNFENNHDYSANKQTPTDIVGYTYVDRAYDQDVTLPDDQAGLYQYKYNIYFYYTRNPHTLNFWNVSDYMVDGKGEQFYYGASLRKFINSDNDKFMSEGYEYGGVTYGPYYPPTLEPNAYEFVGWYTTSGCLDGTRVNWETMTMPDADMTVYAKWIPKTYDVTFYYDYDAYLAETPVHYSVAGASHGEIMKGLDNSKVVPSREGYSFIRWVYEDDAGNKHSFEPTQMPVRQDLKLYAEWRSTQISEYTVYYVLGEEQPDGTITEKLDDQGNKIYLTTTPVTGYAVVGTTKTVQAKTAAALDKIPDGQENQAWFPNTSSHSILIKEDKAVNIFEFLYITKNEDVKYTVHYLDKQTSQPVSESKEFTTRAAEELVWFEYVSGYVPDAVNKRLVLSADEDQNVVIFYYTKEDPGQAAYQVNHWLMGTDGKSFPVEDCITEIITGKIGDEVTAQPRTMEGFEFKGSITVDGKTYTSTTKGEITSGADDDENKPLVLDLYYSRMQMTYKVYYKNQDNSTEIIPTAEKKALYGEYVTETAPSTTDYPVLVDYDLISPQVQSKTIGTADDQNKITFWYKKKNVSIQYIAKCTDPKAENFGILSSSSDFGTNLYGSTATARNGFYFVGWYSDENCTNQVTTSATLGPEGKTQSGVYEYTFYALFKPYELTISQTNMKNASDSAVYDVVNSSDVVVARVMLTGNSSVTIQQIPAGTYTVREISENWTWTYGATSEQIVEVSEGANTVSFTYNYVGSCWLHSENRR